MSVVVVMCASFLKSKLILRFKLWRFPLPVPVLWVAGWAAAAHSAS